MKQLIVNPLKGEIHMHTMASRSTVAAVLLALLLSVPALAQQQGRGGGKGILIKAVISLNKLNATKGYECTATQAKTLLPVLRKLAVAKTMTKDEAGKYGESIRKALTEKQVKKLDALTGTCPTPGQFQGGMGQGRTGGPGNPFYVASGKKPDKGSGAEALHALIAALQKTAK
jgi:hypothetical protein